MAINSIQRNFNCNQVNFERALFKLKNSTINADGINNLRENLPSETYKQDLRTDSFGINFYASRKNANLIEVDLAHIPKASEEDIMCAEIHLADSIATFLVGNRTNFEFKYVKPSQRSDKDLRGYKKLDVSI